MCADVHGPSCMAYYFGTLATNIHLVTVPHSGTIAKAVACTHRLIAVMWLLHVHVHCMYNLSTMSYSEHFITS